MIYIIAGLAVWTVTHAFKRLFPNIRSAMGKNGRGIVTLGAFIAIGLMVFGYKTSDLTILWVAPDWLYAANNVLMLLAVYLFAVGGARTRVALIMRHPMLNGMIVWGVAHLLVNGDLESLVLFGGLIAWAVMTKMVIDRSDAWVLPVRAPLGKELGVLLASIIVYVGIIHLHGALGPWPFWHGWSADGLTALFFPPQS